jgi:hypothetical protein
MLMDNVWFVDGNCSPVSWDAVLPSAWRLENLFAWMQEVVKLGAATRVLVPVEVPRYQAYGEDATNKLLQGLLERYRRGTVDLLDFASFGARHQGNRLQTRISVADPHGSVSEFMVARASELPESIWRGVPGRPDADDETQFFLGVGTTHLFTAERLADYASRSGEISIGFYLSANIWFPWIPNPYSETADYDNRLLANVHTPALNSFLTQVKGLTESMGGRWEYEALAYEPMVNMAGIDLGWLPPNETEE